MLCVPPQYGHSSVVAPNGDVLAEADEHPTIVYADIGEYTHCNTRRILESDICTCETDTQLLASTRSGLPVTVQRRFDVYPNVADGN